MEDHTENRHEVGQHEGHYANYFQIGHNVAEFLLDFGQFYAENGVVQWHTRIITAPMYAQALLELLQESVAQYHQHFGRITQQHSEDTP
jgi:hypothetical protein